MKTLADRIKSLRLQNETQSQFATRLNTTQASISRYLNGRQPDRETLIKIAQKTGVSLDWLLTGSSGPDLTGRNDSELLQAALAYVGDLDGVSGKEKSKLLGLIRDLVENKDLRKELLSIWEGGRKK